jgi:phage-related protein
LEDLGTGLRMPHSEYLGDSIFQLRVQTEGKKVRILYFFLVGKQAILTNGFIKKTPRTPKNELELAKKYKLDYLTRKGVIKS